MDERRHKARKEYTCDHCEKPIIKGEVYSLGKDRQPRYESDGFWDTQIGIEYVSWKICCRCLTEFEESTYEI